jgi:hypothetical protein
MTARKIGQSRRLVLGTPSYFDKAGEPSTPTELAHHAAVIYAHGGGGITWTFRKGANEKTVTLNPTSKSRAGGWRRQPEAQAQGSRLRASTPGCSWPARRHSFHSFPE